MIASLEKKPGERRYADDREIAEPERGERDRQQRAQAAVVAHVHLVVHGVHHRACAEEQAGLEEAVGQQVHDRDRVAGGPEARCEHHVADLAHRGRGEGLLDVVLGATDDRAEQQRDRADDDDAQLRARREVEHRPGPHDQVDTRGDHGRGVDQCGDRGGAFHGVTEPGLQRHLRRLAARGEQQQQTDGVERALAQHRGGGEDTRERDGAEVGEHHHHRDGKADVADAVDHERLLGRGGGRRLVLPEPDQQVGRQADAFPPDVEAEVVVGEHQQQHRGEEQVQVREEPAAPGIFGHVADRVDVDQRADAGDQQHEAHRQLVELQAEVHLQRRRPAPRRTASRR